MHYENRITKHIQSVKSGEGDKKVIEGVGMIKVHYMHE
jgi:hypothetical protein